MGTKQVRLEDRVYAKLADRKREGETFSEAVDRLIDDWSLTEFSMELSETECTVFEATVTEVEETTATNVDEILDEIGTSDE